MITASVVAVAVAAVAVAWPEHGRLLLSTTAGGGWASDLHAGAGRGEGAMGQVFPAARLDLSFSPRIKVGAAADASLTRYQAGAFEAASGSVAADGRWLLGRGEVSLSAAAEHTDLSGAAPVGELATGPDVTGTSSARVAAGGRLRRGPLSARGATGVSWRSSRTDAGDVADRAFSVALGGAWTPCRTVALDLSALHERTASDTPAFAAVTWGGSAGVTAAPLERLLAGTSVQLASSRFDDGATERASRVAVDLSWSAGPVTGLLSWSWSSVRVAAPPAVLDRPAGDRHLVFVGLRGQLKAVTW